MPFRPGTSGNPGGRPKTFLSSGVRLQEAKKTWKRLLQIRDGLILEQQTKDGEPILVTPSIKDLIRVCEPILDRTVGKPRQDMTMTIADFQEDPVSVQVYIPSNGRDVNGTVQTSGETDSPEPPDTAT